MATTIGSQSHCSRGMGQFCRADYRDGEHATGSLQALQSVLEAGATVLSGGLARGARGAGVRSVRGTGGSTGLTRAQSLGNISAGDYGVAFFGDSNLGFYTRENAKIGLEGKPFFFMPLEDSAVVRNVSDAARYTGRAPSAERAYLQAGDIYGLNFPTSGMRISRPTAVDAGGWPHFLEGGHTAVRLGESPTAGYLVNPTREFIISGGRAVPSGSALFKLGQDGEWILLRKF